MLSQIFHSPSPVVLRDDFPALRNDRCYVDNAATTHKPVAVIDAISALYRHNYAPIYRGLYHEAEHMTELYEGVRSSIATWLGVMKHEIVLTYGATDGMNTFIGAWAKVMLGEGDEVVFTELDHHMVVAAWSMVAQERNSKVRVIPICDTTCALNIDAPFLSQVITTKCRVVILPLSSNVRGPLSDEEIEAIVGAARSVGALVIADASQVPAHKSLSDMITRWKFDVVIFSSHKMFGPSGVGVLYIKEGLHHQLVPCQLGGSMIYSCSSRGFLWQKMPRLLEAGTRPVEAVIGLGAAVDYIRKNVDYEKVQQHEAYLTTEVITGIDTIPGVRILGDKQFLKKQGHLLTFVIEGIHSHDIALYLAEHGVAVRAGDHCCQPLHHALDLRSGSVRVSFALYNTIDEARKVVSVVRDAVTQLS